MGEKPRAEPEIIPPIRDDRQSRSGTARIRVFADGNSIRHVYIARLGPLGVLMIALMIGILFTVILVLLVGALLKFGFHWLDCWSRPPSLPVYCADIFAAESEPASPQQR
jgi:hypothetical protein